MKKDTENLITELKTGDILPDLKNIKWLDKKPSVFQKKYTAVIFWNTWDDSSLNSLSEWSELQAKYSDLLTVACLSDQTKKDLEECLKDRRTDFSNGSAPQAVFRNYMEGYYMIPAAFLADSEKKLIWKGHPFYLAKIMKILTEENGSQREVDEFERLRKRFDSLRYAMSGNNSECLSDKEKYKSYALDYLKIYPEDSFVQNILDEFAVLIPNEKIPSLKKIEWVRGEAEIVGNAFLAVFLEKDSDLLNLAALHKKFQSRLSVFGLIKKSRASDFKLGRTKVPIAQITDDLYIKYMTRNTVRDGINLFLISSSGKLLFSSPVSLAERVISFFVSEKSSDKALLKHFKSKELFDQQSRELSVETELSEEQFSLIFELGKNILKLEPNHFVVISRLIDLSCRVNTEKPKQVSAEFETSSWNASLIRNLITELNELEDRFYPAPSLLKWAEKAIALEPETAENYLSCSDVLLRAGRKKEAEVMRKKGEKLKDKET